MTSQDPPNPSEGQDPADPLDDPLLSALERSMENPPGFQDPLAGEDEPYMDELGSLLSGLEADIEDTTLMPRVPGTGYDETADTQEGDSDGPESSEPTDENDPPGMAIDWGAASSNARGPTLPGDTSSMGGRSGPPKAPRGRGGGGSSRRGQGLPVGRRGPGRLGRSMATPEPATRQCPANHETVNQQECEECDKHRHWPEGTYDEPRECWYDWQQSQKSSEEFGGED